MQSLESGKLSPGVPPTQSVCGYVPSSPCLGEVRSMATNRCSPNTIAPPNRLAPATGRLDRHHTAPATDSDADVPKPLVVRLSSAACYLQTGRVWAGVSK
jgi:hypothetical protein